MLRLVSPNAEETREIGRVLGQRVEAGDVFLLTGTLGAGKTCLTQGIAWGLEVQGYVRSPSYVIATSYTGRLTLHHIDLFRINDALEASDLGLEEYLSVQDVCVVEWADRAAEAFPQESTWISLEHGTSETERLISITAQEGSEERLLGDLKRAFRV